MPIYCLHCLLAVQVWAILPEILSLKIRKMEVLRYHGVNSQISRFRRLAPGRPPHPGRRFRSWLMVSFRRARPDRRLLMPVNGLALVQYNHSSHAHVHVNLSTNVHVSCPLHRSRSPGSPLRLKCLLLRTDLDAPTAPYKSRLPRSEGCRSPSYLLKSFTKSSGSSGFKRSCASL